MFIAGIYQAIKYSKRGTPNELSQFLKTAVTSIGGLLATNLGALLGIKVEEASIAGFDAASFFFSAGANVPSTIQLIAAYLYLFCLIAAFVGWYWVNNLKDDPNKVVLLPQLSYTLLGVMVGVFAVSL